jgi:hypothetical protein
MAVKNEETTLKKYKDSKEIYFLIYPFNIIFSFDF